MHELFSRYMNAILWDVKYEESRKKMYCLMRLSDAKPKKTIKIPAIDLIWRCFSYVDWRRELMMNVNLMLELQNRHQRFDWKTTISVIRSPVQITSFSLIKRLIDCKLNFIFGLIFKQGISKKINLKLTLGLFYLKCFLELTWSGVECSLSIDNKKKTPGTSLNSYFPLISMKILLSIDQLVRNHQFPP